jgi:ATP-binding cassette subfamily B multidrug efflux pump
MSTAATLAAEQPAEPRAPRRAWQHLRGLLPYLQRYRARIYAGFAVLIAGNLVGALLPLVIGTIVDSLSGSRALLERFTALPAPLYEALLAFYQPFSRDTLLFYGGVLLGIVALKGLLSFWTRWILIGVSRDIEYDLRSDLLDRLLALEPAFYVRNRTGELMSRATNDLNAVRMVLGPGIMYSGNTLVVMVAAVVLMLKLSPLLTLLVFLPVPVVAFAVRYFGQVIHDRYEGIQAVLAGISARVQENLAGMRVVRAYVQEEAETREFEKLNRDYIRRNFELIRTWSLFYPALEMLIGITFLIVLWQGGRLVLEGTISLGTLMAFYGYMGLLVWPMIALGWVTNIFQRGAASMGRMNYILTAEPAIRDSASPSPLSPDHAPLPVRGEIEFRSLTFAYETSGNGAEPEPVLRDINLRVPAGSTLAIVGPTGSGKSTLAALVARLYDAPAGSVLLDGRPLNEWPLAAVRRAIGFVPQDTFLFSVSVRENIAFGVENAPESDVEEAAQIASIAGDVQDFPRRFDTLVGERGITLSGGQKQRVALARAILRNPKILILDDALSSVDTETEERILRGLAGVMRQRTTILISHRCSTVRHAGRIIVLRDGRIVEQGTHDELLARGGYYFDLYQKQLLEEELERA